MKKIAIMLGCALMVAGMMASQVMAQGAFDQWGYNYEARIFNGLLGYADENRPGDGNPDTYLGSSTDNWSFTGNDGVYHQVIFNVAGTKLVMKWSTAWHMHVFGPDGIRYNGDELSWEDAVAQYGQAWCTNHDVGSGTIDGVTYEKMQGYSRIIWVGDTTGYTNPIWGTCAIVHKVVNAPGVAIVFEEPVH